MEFKFIDPEGLQYLWSKLKALFNGKVDKVTGKGLSTNDYTTTEKNKLSGIASGAEVNQNAFSNIKVGSTTVSADAKTDTLEIAAGSNITITPDATNDKITIAATNTTYGAAGSSLGLVKSGGDVTISNGTITVNDDSHNHTIANVDGLQTALDGKLGTNANAVSSSKWSTARALKIGNTSKNVDGTANVTWTLDEIGASPKAGSTSLSQLANTITLGDGAAGTILQDSATYQQKIEILDNSDSGDGVFRFSQSTNSGDSFSTLMEIRDDGNVVANKFTGSLSGNATSASTASKLTTARTISLGGDLSGSTTFDGSGNVTISATVKDDSHAHTIANVDGLQSALDSKLSTSGTAAKATADGNGQNIADTYIKSLSVNGRTITYTKGDGGTGTITTQDTNTTYSNMKGATTSAAGSSGLVPAPSSGAANRYLRSDGTWSVPPDTNTTYSDMKGATSSANGAHGLVPQPDAGEQAKFLRGDGTWQTPANTTYGAAGTNLGLVKSGGDVTISNGTITVNDNSHSHTISNVDGLQSALDGKLSTSGNAASATKLANARTFSITGGATASGVSFNGTGNVALNVTALDASKLTGTVPIDRLPAGALERLVTVENQAARFSLTTSNVQLGDTVQQLDTGIMYIVVNTGELDNANGYKEYTAATATKVPWSGVTDKPTSFTPSSHTHTIANVTGLQSALDGKLSTTGNAASASKLSTARTISLGGDVTGSTTFDGSGNVTITATVKDDSHNHTIANIDNLQTTLNGKASTSHTHNYAGSSSAGGAATSAAKVNGIQLTNQNLNSYHSGVNFYYAGGGNTCTNKPSGIDNFGMFVFQTAGGWYTQILYGSDDDIYTRRWVSDTWTSWSKLYTTTNKPTASEIGAAASSHTHNYAGSSSAGGAANSANKLTTARTITLSGDASGSVSFDGSGNVTLSVTVKDDSHNHTIANVDGLQTALDGKLSTSGTAAKATADASGQNIADTYIKALSVSGRTITYTKGDGGTGTITTQDTNTTYSNMTGASSSAAGKAGLVPAPSAGSQAKFLRGDGTWQTPTNTTYANMTGATSSAAGKAGLVPAPAAGKQTSFLRGDGTWVIPTNTDTKATQTNTTTNADYRVVLSTNANDTTETNTLRKSVNFQANPSTGAFYAKGYERIDISNLTVDIDDYTLSSGSPHIMRYIEKTSGGASKITNIPVAGQPFILDVELIRWASTTDYITVQTFRSTSAKTTMYYRTCNSGTWTAWTTSPLTYSLSSFGITATAAELNKLDGVTATAKELNYVDGVTSNIQTQLNGKASTSHTHNYAGSSSAGGAANSAVKLSTARTIRTNLGSTSTASFDGSANITPGVTGTLGIGNGGTGATTAAAARTKLGFSGIVVSSTEPTTQNTNEFWLRSY